MKAKITTISQIIFCLDGHFLSWLLPLVFLFPISMEAQAVSVNEPYVRIEEWRFDRSDREMTAQKYWERTYDVAGQLLQSSQYRWEDDAFRLYSETTNEYDGNLLNTRVERNFIGTGSERTNTTTNEYHQGCLVGQTEDIAYGAGWGELVQNLVR